jgi:polyhydroxybutyrate depolymerase
MRFLTSFLFALLCFNISAQNTLNLSLEHDGIQRDYSLYVPENYTGDKPVPLVFNFHGFGSNGSQQAFYGDFRTIADTAGFIVVHPEGTLVNATTHWNVGGFTLGSTTDDVGFTSAMIDSISANYNINADRIYSTGMSNGGYFSFLLACQLSDRIAAIASVTGSMTPETFNECDPQRQVPILQIHGTEDPTVPYGGNPFWSKSIEDVLDYWIAFNACDETPELIEIEDINSDDNSTVDHFIYKNTDTGIHTEHFKVYEGAHTWPGSVFNFPGTNQDFNASLEVWKFFSRYDINGLNPTTAVKTIEKKQLRVFPNPSSDIILVEGDITDPINYEIISTTGSILKSGIISQEDQSIQIGDLPQDFYILKAGNEIHKILKIN